MKERWPNKWHVLGAGTLALAVLGSQVENIFIEKGFRQDECKAYVIELEWGVLRGKAAYGLFIPLPGSQGLILMPTDNRNVYLHELGHLDEFCDSPTQNLRYWSDIPGHELEATMRGQRYANQVLEWDTR